jgi:MATE family multidrug resistance protein
MWGNARRILALAWPILIGQLAIIAFGVIDTAMVGRYSATDLAALGLGASVYISVYIGLTGILSALQPIVGQLFGAGRRDEIGESVRQAAWLGLLLAVLGCTALLYPAGLLRVAHASAELNQRTVTYLRILAFGLPAALGFRIYNALSNAISKPRFVMLVQVASLGLKVPLNAWFIFGGLGLPALGGPGCALASTLINWACALIGLVIMARHGDYAVFSVFKRFSWPRWRDQMALLKLGVPMGLSYLIEVTAYTFMALFIARFGTTALAGHQIAANLGAVLYMTPLAIGIATSTLVSQALGARRRGEARSIALHGILLAFAIALLYGATLAVLRGQVVSAYTPDPKVAAAAAPLILIVVFYHLCDALQVSTVFILRAYKVAVVPTVIYAVALWGVGLGGGYVLGFHLEGTLGGAFGAAWDGARGFWLANTVSLGLAAIGLLAYLRHTSEAPG